jgi:hypothetical protein
MLAALFFLACPPPVTVTDTEPVADTSDTSDTSDTGPDLGAQWAPRVPGPYDQLCQNYPRKPAKEDPDVPSEYAIWQDAGIDNALFQHTAQVLTAKFQAYSAAPPNMEVVCDRLAAHINLGTNLTKPPMGALRKQENGPESEQYLIGDCPNLLPVNYTDMPGNLESYYVFSGTDPSFKTWAAFTNIVIYQWRLTHAMNQTEAELEEMPGCWLEYRLKSHAAVEPFINSMPAILFAIENYSTATVAYTVDGEGSAVVSGADYVVPTPVWYFLNGGAPGAATPYHLTYLLSGYPDNSSFVLNVDSVELSILDDVMGSTPPGGLPSPFTGTGIIDPESDQAMRELDWFIYQNTKVVEVNTDPSNLDLTYSGEFDKTGPGDGFPPNWPEL